MMANKNLKTFDKYKFKKIVTQCPHCLTTLKNDYSELGADFDVVHHSQYIAELIKENKIKPEPWMDEDVTYHDPCYLGRHSNEYDAPRDVIQSIMRDGKLVEMEQSKKESFCCGVRVEEICGMKLKQGKELINIDLIKLLKQKQKQLLLLVIFVILC